MKEVYILHHVNMSEDLDGGEDVKLIGVYSSQFLAEKAVERLKDQQGFRDNFKIVDPEKDNEESGFFIDKYILDEDQWTEGFITV